MPTDDEALEIKNRATQRLLALPGVTAVGLGSKEIDGRPTGELAVKVFVRVKRPPDQVPPDQMIPADIEGIQTDVIESGDIHLVVDPPGAIITSEDTDGTRSRPLLGGRRIRRESSGYEGTMGCFLVSTTDVGKAYGLTNFHVLDVPDVSALTVGTSKAGQPSGSGSVTDCCNDLIGSFAGGGRTDDRDEALILLDPGMQWQAEIADIGVVSGKHQLTQAEATPQTYKVRKRGARTLLTGGVVRALNATTHEADNLVIIQPNANSIAGTRTVFFDYEGDSGSAVVNDSAEVVALVYARDDSGNGYAYAIQHVLDRLNSVEHITVDVAVAVLPGVVNTVPGAAMVLSPPELAGVLGTDGRPAPASRPVPPAPLPGWLPEPALLAPPAHLEHDLDRSVTGRLLITTWLEHQAELLRLVNTNRRVSVAWHRSGVSALFQLLIRMTADPQLALPMSLHGRPLRTCLTRMRVVLDRFASPQLSADLARLDRVLPDCAGMTYGQVVESLGSG